MEPLRTPASRAAAEARGPKQQGKHDAKQDFFGRDGTAARARMAASSARLSSSRRKWALLPGLGVRNPGLAIVYFLRTSLLFRMKPRADAEAIGLQPPAVPTGTFVPRHGLSTHPASAWCSFSSALVVLQWLQAAALDGIRLINLTPAGACHHAKPLRHIAKLSYFATPIVHQRICFPRDKRQRWKFCAGGERASPSI